MYLSFTNGSTSRRLEFRGDEGATSRVTSIPVHIIGRKCTNWLHTLQGYPGSRRSSAGAVGCSIVNQGHCCNGHSVAHDSDIREPRIYPRGL